MVLLAVLVLGGTDDTIIAKYQAYLFFIITLYLFTKSLSSSNIVINSNRIKSMLPVGLFIVLQLFSFFYTLSFTLTIRFITFWLLFFAMLIIVINRRFSHNLISCIKWISVVLAISIILSSIMKEDFVSVFSFWLLNKERVILDIYYGQYSGLVGDRAFAAIAMCTGLFAHIADLFANKQNARSILLRIGCMLLLIIAMMLTGKRIALIMLLFPLLLTFMFFMNRKHRKRAILISVIVAVFVFLATQYMPESKILIERLMLSSDYSSVNGRLELWNAALNMFFENPILGQGLGSYNVYNYNQGTGQLQFAHNQYLQFLPEVGIVGSVVLVAIFIASLRTTLLALKEAKTSPDSQNKYIAVFSFMTQISIFTYGLTGYPFYNLQQFYLYILTISFSIAVLGTNDSHTVIGRRGVLK
ncbi:lipid A core-O-antigen ligase-like enyme [Desulfosporosinus orientis DSM 765]|uniref:Lipid A core-O-antigen ligase-like enyme n=2 Tax=Desulfosporosinus orientis TaxID=1563 RepID=G7W767_DESOD|nr:lipid A core-O-antigen ligase-like enyme [Desulfosporosinus orientis DSM 765]